VNYAINVVAIYGIYFLYPRTHGILCESIPGMEGYAIFFGCVIGTMFTFITEGMANWDRWKQSLSESEKLRNAYQRSKLLGLKGQINPHFLFNCFNTLSALITVDKEEAEEFLNEMTKVHRYMLRSDDEYLVTLADEMKFAHSYLSLTKSRFGAAVIATIDIQPGHLEKQVPPLTLQAILENIIYTNALNKQQPLTIHISSKGDYLSIDHTVHDKIVVQPLHEDDGLDNLVNKYRLLNKEEIRIIESPLRREIVLPLFDPKNLVHETS
jgi:LytS/YehU family sensor histidine kinase